MAGQARPQDRLSTVPLNKSSRHKGGRERRRGHPLRSERRISHRSTEEQRTAAAPSGTAHLGLPVLEREDREKGGVAKLPTSFGMDYDDAKFFTILTELSRQWSGGVGVPANSGEERLGTPPPRRGWGM